MGSVWGSFLDWHCPHTIMWKTVVGLWSPVCGDLSSSSLAPECLSQVKSLAPAHAVSESLPVTVAGQAVECLGGPHGWTLRVLGQAAERAPEGRAPVDNQRASFRA